MTLQRAARNFVNALEELVNYNAPADEKSKALRLEVARKEYLLDELVSWLDDECWED